MATSRVEIEKYIPYNAIEAYTLRDARIRFIGTYFHILRGERPKDFLAFSKRRWRKLEDLTHVTATDLAEQVPPRDHLYCPEDITRVDPALLLSDEVFAKGAEEDETEDAVFEDDEAIPANVVNWIDDQQKRLHEAHICEILAKNPHPNVIAYYGCDVRGNYIHSLILEYLPHKLADRFLDKSNTLDVEKCIRGIEAGLSHMHSLGLVHLDIAPRNIMLREDDAPVIIDFDLTQRNQELLGENFHAGEPYYHKYDTHANPQLDIYALDLLKEWLRTTPPVEEAAWRHKTWPEKFHPPDYYPPPSEPSSHESTGSNTTTQPAKKVNSVSEESSTSSDSESRSISTSPIPPSGLTVVLEAPAPSKSIVESATSLPTGKRKERSRSLSEDLESSECPYLCPDCGFHKRGDRKNKKIKANEERHRKQKPIVRKTSSPSQRRKPRCSNCSGEGHNVKTCGESCSLCEEKAHRSRECPLKVELGRRGKR